ncbi:extracellular solute-binding protein [Stygiolobus caldivivus]|uniref:ABC transporter substrate-binding protein n=1 Tax=Stygiolobus caldivivus TaxID=2824673 RepID=A0A8D5U4L3_9CREN|nr:extracellular solute-binding protein [Stygiolobus caldivivus]BCU69162.1 ABC transporter substrate-binding protein [Stygiolobus caldivivus]
MNKHTKKFKAISSYVIIAIIVIAIIAIAGVLLLYHPSSTTPSTTTTTITTTSTTTSISTSTTTVTTTSTMTTSSVIPPPSSNTVIVYVAGAYKAIFNYLAMQFEKEYGIQVDVVPGGSFGLAAEIAHGTPVDDFVPVAYIQAVELEGPNNPGWAIAFISDQMSLVYSNYTTMNPYWGQLYGNYTMAMKTNETQYWYNFFQLLTTKFSLGISNPNSDPEGLYGYLILKMAGYLYANHSFDYFIHLANVSGVVHSAPTTADFVAPLKAGELDFVFSYKSYAISQHLEYLQLPPWLSFGYFPNETSWYSFFFYKISVNGQTLKIYGNPVYLYITIPKNAPNQQLAIKFLQFVVQNVNELSMFGVTPITHPVLFYENQSDVPQQVLSLLNEGVLKYGGNFTAV